MNKNNRTITDLKTGVDLPQHKMLKVLFERSGLKRNDWHDKARQLVASRSLGSPTKISDIFNGNSRSLPMRDIVPYIQALGMRKSETDYYIAEFFKAYCDENLHQYVQSKSKSQQILMLEQKLRVKEFEVKKLNRQVQLLQHKIQRTNLTRTNQNADRHQRVLKILASQSLQSDNVTEAAPVYQNWESENSLRLNNEHHKLYNSAISEHHKTEVDEILEGQNSIDLHYEIFEQEVLSPYICWFLLLTIIKEQINNIEFCSNIALLIPESFTDQIVTHNIHSTAQPMPALRTVFEFVASKIAIFKNKNETAFKRIIADKSEYLKNKTKLISMHEEVKLLDELKNRAFDDELNNFNVALLNSIPSYLCNKEDVPFDIGFICFEKQEISDAVHQFFEDYINFKDLGLSFTAAYDELCTLQNPPISLAALRDEAMLVNLLSIIKSKSEEICEQYGFPNPIQKVINHEDYPNFIQNSQQRKVSAPSWMDRFTDRNEPR